MRARKPNYSWPHPSWGLRFRVKVMHVVATSSLRSASSSAPSSSAMSFLSSWPSGFPATAVSRFVMVAKCSSVFFWASLASCRPSPLLVSSSGPAFGNGTNASMMSCHVHVSGSRVRRDTPSKNQVLNWIACSSSAPTCATL